MSIWQTAVAGTTITASWGNNVRDGLNNTFASEAARDSAITASTEGMICYLQNRDATYMCIVGGTPGTWVRVSPKGRVNGTRYNAGTGVIIAGAGIGPSETLTGISTPAVTLEANRSFVIRVRFRILVANAGAGIVVRVRETNISGAIRATLNDVLASGSVTYEKEFTGIYETGAVDETKTYVVTGLQSSGVANYYAGDSTTAVYIDVWDVGPAGSITVV